MELQIWFEAGDQDSLSSRVVERSGPITHTTIDKYVGSSAPRLNDDMKRQKSSRSISLGCFCIALFSLAVFGLAMLVIGFMRALSKPHSSHYVYPKSGTLPGSTVVKPLVAKKGDPGGLFDIHATVWMKAPKLAWPELGRGEWEPEGDSAIQSPSESVIFSGTIFTAVHLQEKNLQTAIELRIPTDIFKNRVVSRTDLRASFVLIPLSPSPLDNAVNISTVNTEHLNSLLVRPYSTPYPYQHSMLDNIIDSYGISTPLLDLQPYVVICNETGPDINHLNLLDHVPTYPMDSDDEVIVAKVGKLTVRRGWSVGFKTVQAHPHIITRTFLRVADMTLLYDNKSYDERHQALKSTKMACAQNKWTEDLCDRRFEIYGNFETKIRLKTRDPITGEPTYEWAYALYMSAADKAWGPKDLIPIPLTTDVCVPPTSKSTIDPSIETGRDVSFVNVTWHVAYSGRTPGKLILGDLISASDIIPLNTVANDNAKIVKQSHHALLQGLMGHQYRGDFHPRVQFTLQTISVGFLFVERIWTTYYFYDLSSTVGLSTIGATLLGMVWLLDYFWETIAKELEYNGNLSHIGWRAILFFVPQITALCMIKAALRAELEWYPDKLLGSIPRVRFAAPSHRERASRRVESRVHWLWIAVWFTTCAIALYFLPVDKIYIIGPRNTIARKFSFSKAYAYYTYFRTYIFLPACTLAQLLQIIHNHISKTFAGTYKPIVWISAIGLLAHVASESTAVVGNRDVRAGVTISYLIQPTLRIVELVQTLLYPSVGHLVEDADMD